MEMPSNSPVIIVRRVSKDNPLHLVAIGLKIINCGQARIKYFPCLYFKGIEAQLGSVVCIEA